MLTRMKVLSRAAEDCMKELYSLVQPHIDWNTFVKDCEQYSERSKTWEDFRQAFIKKNEFPQEWEHQKIVHPNWENKSITECIGPRPYDYYYIPEKVMDTIVEGYVDAYKIDNHRELLDIINILKQYCEEPIIDKYTEEYTDEHGNYHPGDREYDRPDNLIKEVESLLRMYCGDSEADFHGIAQELQKTFFDFLDMAGNFYKWNGELNSFCTEVYLGISPNTNKQGVIDNWKNYRKQNIIIDDSKYDEYDEE